MRRWQATFYLLILCENSLVVSLLSGKSILKIIPDLLGRKATDLATDAGTEDPGTIVMAMTTMLARSDETTTREPMVTAIAFQTVVYTILFRMDTVNSLTYFPLPFYVRLNIVYGKSMAVEFYYFIYHIHQQHNVPTSFS
ncbi:hypothetical protein ABMA27_016768 [Loxostege sticticalis]|uniref:Uncharacterized protein n=1 Tax=Loxostege sticticalis TaxID=481309 RepID=A0ABR3I3N9_LOXSC